MIKKILTILLVSSVVLQAGDFDNKKYLQFTTAYGAGNFIPGFYNLDNPTKRNYSEIFLEMEFNVDRQLGVILSYDEVRGLEKGFGKLSGNFGTAILFMNSEYFGFNFGISSFERDRGFYEEDPDLGGTFPTLGFKLGLINKFYFTFSIQKDFINYPLVVNLKYHFPDYFSQVSIGRIFNSVHLPDLYLLKIQKLVFENYILAFQAHLSSDNDLNGIRVSFSYILKW